MVTHYILISSSYSYGKRIGLHYILDGSILNIENIFANILAECGDDVAVSTHLVDTNSKDWSSVVEKDSFFENIELLESLDIFIDVIKRDRTIIGLDVAKYILKKIDCTHLKLQKLTYFCYADYLCKTNKKLFKDKIYAYELGPIIKSIYDKYKGQRRIIDDQDNVSEISTSELSLESRILFTKDGAEKLKSIDDTLEKYKDLTAMNLVNLTHKENTPWSQVGGGSYCDVVITDDKIKEFHKYEEI